jgi:hypothetical protein
MLRIMVWDSPNMNKSLEGLYGRRVESSERVRLDRVMDWLVFRGVENGDILRAGAFFNIRASSPGYHKFKEFIDILFGYGYHIGLKQKDEDDSDIDDLMVAFIDEQIAAHPGEKAEIIIASHDAQCFMPVITRLRQAGHQPLVLGYTELGAGYDGTVVFTDLESIDGAFRKPLPRALSLTNLPAGGEIFTPLNPPSTMEERVRSGRTRTDRSPRSRMTT